MVSRAAARSSSQGRWRPLRRIPWWRSCFSVGARCVWPGDDVQLHGEVQISVVVRSQETTAAIEKHLITGDMRDNKLVMIEMIDHNPYTFYLASDELKRDRDFLLRVIKIVHCLPLGLQEGPRALRDQAWGGGADGPQALEEVPGAR